MKPRWLTAELTNSYTLPLNEPGYALSTPESFAKIYLPISLLSLPLGVSVAVSGQLPTASSTSLNTPTGQQWYPRQTGLVETVRKWVREDIDLWGKPSNHPSSHVARELTRGMWCCCGCPYHLALLLHL